MATEIYCGPILRKVDKQSVNIWLALRTDEDITATLSINTETLACDTACDKIQVAPSLYIYMLTLTPESEIFPENQLLHYDLYNDGQSLLSDGELSYDFRNPLPSFIIAEPAPFLTGSCRKIHSHTDDMLVYADEILKERWNDITQRPKALFLTGDQIYADDVDAEVLNACREISLQLFDENHLENFPPLEPGEEASQLYLKIPGGDTNKFRRWRDWGEWDREQFTADVNFTSMKADNHLVLFAEYVALYLLTWSDMPWRNSQNSQSETVRTFIKGLPRTRRLMANIPTYMIFDDHEITDDWNINQHWSKKVKAPGKQIIANAMASYFLFQGWGNYPCSESAEIIRPKVNNYVQALINQQSGETLAVALKELIEEKDNWSYELKYDNCQVLVLDIRCNRHLGDDAANELSGLMSPAFIEKSFENIDENLETLIIVSPTPYFGFSKVENTQNVLGTIGLFDDVSIVDRETWSGDKESPGPVATTTAFENQLFRKNPKQLFIVSGDVHYGFVKKGNFKNPLSENDGLKHVWQITASALKNEPPLKTLFKMLIKDTNDEWFEANYHDSEKPNLTRSFQGTVIFDGPNIAEINYFDRLSPVKLYHRKNKRTERHSF